MSSPATAVLAARSNIVGLAAQPDAVVPETGVSVTGVSETAGPAAVLPDQPPLFPAAPVPPLSTTKQSEAVVPA